MHVGQYPSFDAPTHNKRTLKDIVDPYLPRKRHILPAVEMLTGITAAGEQGRKPTWLDLAMATPVVGAPLKTVKLWRGINKWFPKRKLVGDKIVDTGERMVEKGRYMGPEWGGVFKGTGKGGELHTTPTRALAVAHARKGAFNYGKPGLKEGWDPRLLEFDVPLSEVKKIPGATWKRNTRGSHWQGNNMGEVVFPKGIDKKHLTKVHSLIEEVEDLRKRWK